MPQPHTKMPETSDVSVGTATSTMSTFQKLTASYNPQYSRTNITQEGLDSNGNEAEFLPHRNDHTNTFKGLRLGKASQQTQSAPLTLGGFARTLLKKGNDENVPKDNEFALSPNSVRKLMYFPPGGVPKPKIELPRSIEVHKENIAPSTPSPLESKKLLAESAHEVGFPSKSICKAEGDSWVAHSLSSATEALDLSAGSANKPTLNLQPIQECHEPPSISNKYQCPDRTDTPRKLDNLKPSRSEGCININVVKEPSTVYKPSPPFRLDGQMQHSVSIKGALLIPGNPVSGPLQKTRKSSSDLIGFEGKGQSKPKRIEKCSSLRGTPKGFDPSKLKDLRDVDFARTRVRGRIDISPKIDWNFETEAVQGRNYLLIKQLGKGASGEVSLVIESQTKGLFALKKVNLAGINELVIQECINEIQMLVELKDTDLVIKIQAWEINKMQQNMKIVMEYGQCDLGSSLKNSTYSLHQVRSTWESMLRIVSKIHERGIVHSDLKPANFVWVGNHLKIIDFGIAARLQNDHTSISMLNPKGTLNYISPETIRPDVTGKWKIGPKSDIWSLGCILFLMVYGKTPFHDHTHYMSKITAIASGNIIYPPLPPAFEGSGVNSVLQMCFIMDHRQRPTAADLLKHPFLPGPNSYCFAPSTTNVFKKPFQA